MAFDLDHYLLDHLAMTLQLKTAKMWHILSCPVFSTARTVLDRFLPYLAQIITSIERMCCAQPSLTLTNIFKVNQPIKLLKYGTSCRVCSAACTFQDGFFPNLAQMITSMRGCVYRSKVKVTRVIQIFVVRAGDILVDHWFTISSWLQMFIFLCVILT